MTTIKIPLAVATAALAALLPAGVADAARYAIALLAERTHAHRCGC